MKTTLISILALYFLTGCDLKLDNTQRLSGSLIVKDDGSLDVVAYESALMKKFPIGSSTKRLLSYVESQDGRCASQNNEYSCRIYYHTTICIADYVDITVHGLKTIGNIEVIEGAEGC
jgi:hypothetical protein